MTWLRFFLCSSIGRKQFLAVTGLFLIGFLFSHLAGNLLMLKSGADFNKYAEFLTHHPLLIPAEIGLATLFLAHILMGLKLAFENWQARPGGYAVSASAGGRTVGSSTMPYTGVLILIFICLHVITLRILNPGGDLFGWTMTWFANPGYTAFYAAAMLGLALHLSHGFQSALQTFGLHHPCYSCGVKYLGFLLALGLGAAFGALPILGYLGLLPLCSGA